MNSKVRQMYGFSKVNSSDYTVNYSDTVYMAFMTEHADSKITHRLHSQRRRKCLLPCRERLMFN